MVEYNHDYQQMMDFARRNNYYYCSGCYLYSIRLTITGDGYVSSLTCTVTSAWKIYNIYIKLK